METESVDVMKNDCYLEEADFQEGEAVGAVAGPPEDLEVRRAAPGVPGDPEALEGAAGRPERGRAPPLEQGCTGTSRGGSARETRFKVPHLHCCHSYLEKVI